MSGHSQRVMSRAKQFAYLAIRNAEAVAHEFGTAEEEQYFAALGDLMALRYRSVAERQSAGWRDFEAYLMKRLESGAL